MLKIGDTVYAVRYTQEVGKATVVGYTTITKEHQEDSLKDIDITFTSDGETVIKSIANVFTSETDAYVHAIEEQEYWLNHHKNVMTATERNLHRLKLNLEQITD